MLGKRHGYGGHVFLECRLRRCGSRICRGNRGLRRGNARSLQLGLAALVAPRVQGFWAETNAPLWHAKGRLTAAFPSRPGLRVNSIYKFISISKELRWNVMDLWGVGHEYGGHGFVGAVVVFGVCVAGFGRLGLVGTCRRTGTAHAGTSSSGSAISTGIGSLIQPSRIVFHSCTFFSTT